MVRVPGRIPRQDLEFTAGKAIGKPRHRPSRNLPRPFSRDLLQHHYIRLQSVNQRHRAAVIRRIHRGIVSRHPQRRSLSRRRTQRTTAFTLRRATRKRHFNHHHPGNKPPKYAPSLQAKRPMEKGSRQNSRIQSDSVHYSEPKRRGAILNVRTHRKPQQAKGLKQARGKRAASAAQGPCVRPAPSPSGTLQSSVPGSSTC